jgi:hypothetical protein
MSEAINAWVDALLESVDAHLVEYWTWTDEERLAYDTMRAVKLSELTGWPVRVRPLPALEADDE